MIWLLVALVRALFGNVLGEVQAPSVMFVNNGQTGLTASTLIHTRLSAMCVGSHTTEWRWQYRLPAKKKKWQDLAITRHRIYTVLDSPTAPWQHTPYQQSNIQLPWTDVLDYACQWALGASNAVAAAAAVTRGVNGLGPALVNLKLTAESPFLSTYPLAHRIFKGFRFASVP